MHRRSITRVLALAALVAGTASADVPPRAQVVIDHYVEATGGRVSLEAERATHARGRMETITLKGTIE